MDVEQAGGGDEPDQWADSMKPHRLVLKRDARGRWRWRAIAGNNRVVGASEQGYRSKRWAVRKALQAFPDGVVEFDPPARDAHAVTD